MSTHTSRAWTRALVAILSLAGATPVIAGDLKITVTSNQPAGGFAFSPVWVGVQDGTYQTFTGGSTVSPALQAVAELGDSSLISAAFAGHGSQTTVGSAPFGPGASASTILNVANPATNRYLDFAAMVVPSNDFFFANQDPKAVQIFDASGNFVGPITVKIFGAHVWDAGSEVNNINLGAAFIVGDDAHDHVAEGSTIMSLFGGSTDFTSYLNSINGKATPYGYNISHIISADDLIATITINSVPEPSTWVMFGLGGAGTVVGLWWKKHGRTPITM